MQIPSVHDLSTRSRLLDHFNMSFYRLSPERLESFLFRPSLIISIDDSVIWKYLILGHRTQRRYLTKLTQQRVKVSLPGWASVSRTRKVKVTLGPLQDCRLVVPHSSSHFLEIRILIDAVAKAGRKRNTNISGILMHLTSLSV